MLRYTGRCAACNQIPAGSFWKSDIKGAADRAAKKREKEDEQRRERYILQMDSRKATFDLLSCICAGIERMETETGQIYWNGELKRCLSHLEGVDERYRESDQRQLAELNTRNK